MAILNFIAFFKLSSFVLGAAFSFVRVVGLVVPARSTLKFFPGSGLAVSLGATTLH